MEEKAIRYLTRSQGQITAVLVIKIQYRAATWAKVSLVVADEDGDNNDANENASQRQLCWFPLDEVFYDEGVNYQPLGQVDLYLSDLLSRRLPIPLAFRRPTTAELVAGIYRYEIFVLIPVPRAIPSSRMVANEIRW